MGINQAIYTSSAKGIKKGGGLGVHTYNQNCDDADIYEFEMSFCQYQYSGKVEDISILPTKCLYKKLPSGRYMMSEVTYLGQDYDKNMGRMGNLLSHMYSFGKVELCTYPMELYGSSDFRTFMKTEEVDGTEAVEYLPEVSAVEKGTELTIEKIQEFLEEDRMEMFCHLLASVLHIDTVHKVIILDTHENIVKWVGAVEYALPLQCAREISFSTYENDPAMSEFDIRGAVYGLSTGDYEEYQANGQFYVFDGIRRIYPEFDISSAYFQFGIQMGLSYSYDSLQEFFKFMEGYSYEKADMDICSGFELFQMAKGGMNFFQSREFMQAVSFEGKYGNNESYLEMLKGFAKGLETADASDRKLLQNLNRLITDFLRKRLSRREVEEILEIAVNISAFFKEEEIKDMWKNISVILAKEQSENLQASMDFLAGKKAHRELGEIQAYIIGHIKRENVEKHVSRFYFRHWTNIPLEKAPYFNVVLYAAASVFRENEAEEERYKDALNLFLAVQEMGDGNIYGKGCEALLELIEDGTRITDKKGFQLNKKKKDGELFAKKQAKCAFEAFNYVQRNNAPVFVSRIRMKHLADCIVKTYEENIPMTQSKALQIYAQYPVSVSGVGNGELTEFFEFLLEIITTAETEREEYLLFLKFWQLTKEQKEILIHVLADAEFTYTKKEKESQGAQALMGAVAELGDTQYRDGLKKYVSEMRESFKEKVSDVLLSEAKGDVREMWEEISREEAREGKKSFFKFIKRNNDR